MEIKKEYELLENASVKLKITIPEVEIKNEYDTLVKDYCSKAVIKGFRKGKIPSNVLICKYGDSLKDETAQNLIRKVTEQTFENPKYKLLPYDTPKIKDKINLELDKPLTFEISYDTYPEVKLGEYKKLEIEEPVVKITNEDTKRELDSLQNQNAVIMEKEGGKVEKDDIVTINYIEIDEQGGDIEKTKREGFTFTVGSGYNIYKIDDDIINMTSGEEKILSKEYPEDFEDKHLAGRKIRLKIKVTTIKEKKLPEINDELAQDVSEKYKTLNDLKTDLIKRLEETVKSRIREKNIINLLNKIKEKSEVPLPESMVLYNLKARFQKLIQNLGGNEKMALKSMLENQENKAQDIMKEWRPQVEESIKTSLIIEKIGNVEKVEVSEEELDEEIKKTAEIQKKSFEEVKKQLTEKNIINSIRENMKIEKIYNILLTDIVIKHGNKVNFLDLMKENN